MQREQLYTGCAGKLITYKQIEVCAISRNGKGRMGSGKGQDSAGNIEGK